MPIYWGRRLIKNRGDSGIYFGGRKIKFVYFGNRLVYSYESYDPGTVRAEVVNGASATVELKPGVYQINAAGGGGSSRYWAFDSAFWAAGGGSGAAVDGLIYLAETKTAVVTSGGNSGTSSITLNGVTIVNCTGGRNGGTGGGGAGGTATITESGFTNMTLTGKNGNTGKGVTPGTVQIGGKTVSDVNWGEGTKLQTTNAVQYGGVKITYLRRWQ